jgi:hypothetical protein
VDFRLLRALEVLHAEKKTVQMNEHTPPPTDKDVWS